MIQAFVFYLFATVIVAAAAMTILARNPVHSVLWLILAFFNGAGLMLLLGAEFIALILVIVYVGAVAVLFLFVVMMLDVDFASLRAGFARYWPFATLLAVVLLAELIFALLAWQAGGIALDQRAAPVTERPNIEEFGLVLYSRFIYVFLASGVLLLVAMVGAIVLTQHPRGDSKPQNIGQQVRRRPEDAVRMTSPESGKGVEL